VGEITPVENAGKESPKTEFLNLFSQIDVGIHWTIILQEVREERGCLLLRIIQSRNKKQKSTLAYEATIFCSNQIVAILNWAMSLNIGEYIIEVLANLIWATSVDIGVNIRL
jgi:hypothetical protein